MVHPVVSLVVHNPYFNLDRRRRSRSTPMEAPRLPEEIPDHGTDIAMSRVEADRRQAVYAARRRDWAERVGRPYKEELDLRPPPGELDVGADE